MRHVQADQRHWDAMSAEQREHFEEEEESPFQRIVTNIDDYKKMKRSNLYQPHKVVTVPGAPSQPLVTCSGSGDAANFDLALNQRYQTFENISLFSAKFQKKQVGGGAKTKTAAQNSHLRRPKMEINAVMGNTSLSPWTFKELGINDRLCEALWKVYRIKHASHIQAEVIRNFFEHHDDIIGTSTPGSGKTLAYLLPVLHRFLVAEETALIVTASKFLNHQVYQVGMQLLHGLDGIQMKPTDIVGGGVKLHSVPIALSAVGQNVCSN